MGRGELRRGLCEGIPVSVVIPVWPKAKTGIHRHWSTRVFLLQQIGGARRIWTPDSAAPRRFRGDNRRGASELLR